MGTDAAEVVENLPHPRSFKVHAAMCTELMKFLDRIKRIFPDIEAARPRCTSGIQSLCLLNNAIEKAELLLQHCSESSKLYLAITANPVLSRCRKSKNLLEQGLSQIENMVPVMLAIEISRVIDDLRAATFVLDSSEEEAGKILRELLHTGVSASDLESLEIKTLQVAASRLYITSPKAILIERRSIKRLLDKVGDGDHNKRKILNYLDKLLKKYGNLIKGQHTDYAYAQDEGSFSVCSQSFEAESRLGDEKYEAQTNILTGAKLPEELKCPMSMRLMYDPVIIESGQTFERMWIQKWFDEGNDTCPISKVNLTNRSLTPNTAMKDLISKWCAKYGIPIRDPKMQPEAAHTWDTSFTSIASLSNSLIGLQLPLDVSNVSLRSDTSCGSDASFNKIADGFSMTSMQSNDDFYRYQASTNINEIDLSTLAELKWDSRCKMVEDAEIHVKQNNQACHSLSSSNFVEPLIKFLRDAQELPDIRAQIVGSQLLLAFVNKNRRGIPSLHEDAFDLLASFLDSEVTKEALAIIEVLSTSLHCRSKFFASGALSSILKILDSQNREFQEHAIKILHNLSSDNEIHSHLIPSECIPKLVPFLNDTHLAGCCLVIMRNMCDTEDGRVSVTGTSGCLASIAQLLDTGSREDQEHAVAILLCLCSQRVHYCRLVMNEGVIPALFSVSVNGNDKGKAGAQELLRLLRGVEFGDEEECPSAGIDASRDASSPPKEEKPSSRRSRFFGKRLFGKKK